MSRSVFVGFKGDGFWAYDVVSSTYLGFLTSAANVLATDKQQYWLEEAVRAWHINMEISDYGLHLDEDWSESQLETVRELCRFAIKKIRGADTILWSDIEMWPILPVRRGHDSIPSEPVAGFGEAIIALLEGKLAQPPTGHWWFYTLDDKVDLIERATL